MTPNRHPTTGVRYTIYHINNDLHPEVWYDIHADGTDLSWAEAAEDFAKRAKRAMADMAYDLCIHVPEPHIDDMVEQLVDHFHYTYTYDCDEPVYEGETQVAEGTIKWRTTWLGGAPHLMVFESPYFGCGLQASPCVPGAICGNTILSIWRDEAAAAANAADGDYGYCLPTTWLRDKED